MYLRDTQFLETLPFQLVMFDEFVGTDIVISFSIFYILANLLKRLFDPSINLYKAQYLDY